MKKKPFVMCLVIVVSFLFFAAVFDSRIEAVSPNTNPGKKSLSHPVVTTPENTLAIYLNAFIEKDIDAVMAYVPEGEGDQLKKWREQVKANAQDFMTTKKYVKNIIGITLQKVENQKGGKVAYLLSKIEVSQDFFGPGIDISDSHGKSSIICKWVFRQPDLQGPWFYAEGGF
jgi:hypothetical protein